MLATQPQIKSPLRIIITNKEDAQTPVEEIECSGSTIKVVLEDIELWLNIKCDKLEDCFMEVCIDKISGFPMLENGRQLEDMVAFSKRKENEA